MKYLDCVRLFTESGIDNPRHDAAMLFEHFCKIKRAELLTRNFDSESTELKDAVERRCKREPLQYIIGEVDFYRERYTVTPDCLIPRSDTEVLVELATKKLPRGARFLDLCTGSGCVAVSTLKNSDSTTAVATDISESALKIAKKNAEKNGVIDRIEFLQNDALREAVLGDFFAILSNPPYVTEEAYNNLAPEIYFEPREALVAENGGLIFYERILELYKDKIHTDGFFAFEIGYDQGEALISLGKKFGFFTEIIKDYSGNDRVAYLKR